eukprot:2219046-Amphidinium_carterae.1
MAHNILLSLAFFYLSERTCDVSAAKKPVVKPQSVGYSSWQALHCLDVFINSYSSLEALPLVVWHRLNAGALQLYI